MTSAPPPKTDNPLERLLGYQLRRAAIAMQADLAHRVAGLELTLVELSILQVVEANPSITQSDIGRMLTIKRANMAPMTALMEARGLIARTAVDGRSHGLILAPKGEAVLTEAHARIRENEERLVSLVPEAERDRLISLVRLVREATE